LAQEWQLGVRGGPNLSLTSEWNERYAPGELNVAGETNGIKLGGNIGVFTRIEVIDLGCFFVSVQPGLQLTRKGLRERYSGYTLLGQRGGAGQDALSMYYLQLPAQAQFGYHLGDMTFSVGAGAFGSFLLQNTASSGIELGEDGAPSGLVTKNEAQAYLRRGGPAPFPASYGFDRRPDAGVLGSITFTYSFFGPGNLVVDLRYEHGLLNTLGRAGAAGGGGRKTRNIALSAGYAYDLD
jgi:hypothetical protein